MKYKLTNDTPDSVEIDTIEADTILDALEKGRIFSIQTRDPKTIRIVEECDCHFSITLNKEQLMALVEEIKQIASELNC